MSKIGKKPISLPQGVTLTPAFDHFLVRGPKGEVKIKKLPYVEVSLSPDSVLVSLSKNIKQGRSNWGTLRSLLAGAIQGVTEGFSKKLEINGIGFRAAVDGHSLLLNVGFSHPVKFSIPEDISITVEKNLITVSGFNKDLVGRTAANIRAIKKPEPYKGKGIKYLNEVIIRKAGKKVGATS